MFATRRYLKAPLISLAILGCGSSPISFQQEFETMGTVARVEIFHSDPAAARAGFAAVEAVFDSVALLMSTWNPASEISRLNHAPADSAFVLSDWVNRCLSDAEAVHEASEGAFDPTAEPLMRLWGFYRREGRLPSEAEIDSVRALLGGYEHDSAARSVVKKIPGTAFDFGGIAKGFAVDRAAEALRDLGIGDCLVDLGGNLFCLGSPPGKDRWRVGIRNPLDRDRLFASVETSERAVATSGSYERFVTIGGHRYGHIMNPATGRPAEGLLSATVLAPDATLADGLSTALFVMGPERAKELLARSYPGAEAILVLPSEEGKSRVLISESLAGRVRILPEAENEYAIETLR